MSMQMATQLLLFSDPPRDFARRQRRATTRRQECPRHPENRGHHENSLAAHDALDHALTGRRAEIVAWLNLHGPATDRQIVEGLFFAGADMNLVRPRVSELIDDTVLAECGKVDDHVTGRPVMLVDLASRVPPGGGRTEPQISQINADEEGEVES